MKNDLKTTIGLEIHVQLATKSKMFCRCNNNAEGKAPNTVVCPICLGMPGSLPVANEQAVKWTIKTGIALGCTIPKIAKFDRKHYFYPDLPKGYQISQYDEPFCVGGYIEIDGHKVRLNRIHLEEDAGKLIHSNGKSLVDLNRAGTPLMEMVTEPDIVSPKEAGDFLRKLQKIVRDVVKVSEASMEKGHMRCDANISVTDGEKMSPIIELKNINSFRFVEKALTLVEAQLRDQYEEWPEKNSKETWGYDSKADRVYLQRKKEEAADYRYFPEPDLPPYDTSKFDLNEIGGELGESEEEKIAKFEKLGVANGEASVLASHPIKEKIFEAILKFSSNSSTIAKLLVHNNWDFSDRDIDSVQEYAEAIDAFEEKKITKNIYQEIVLAIHKEGKTYKQLFDELGAGETADESQVEKIIGEVLLENPKEVESYKSGKTALLGFFMGQVMKKTSGKADPKLINKLLIEKLR